MARRVFYSFHYEPDNWRASQVRNIGVIEGNRPATDNDWEAVKGGGDVAIRRWIARQMRGRSCTVVLVGAATANRKWINYEIERSWDEGMGVVGVRVHGLKDANGDTSPMGANPFQYAFSGRGLLTRGRLSSVIRCYDPAGRTSSDRYVWIREHLANAVEEAIRIRSNS